MLDHNIFNTIFVFPTLNLLVFFFKALSFLKIPGAFGFAIIALTIFVRLLLHPFFEKQLETTKKMQDLKPHLDRLSAKHKKDPKKLQAEQMRLYQEAGINPAVGCLFMIVQIPIFLALYNTLSLFLTNGTGNKVISQINAVLYHPALTIQSLNPHFFIYDLALSPQKAGVWYYYLVPVVTAALQYLQVKSATPPKAVEKAIEKQAEKKAGSSSEDFQKAMNTQMKFIFPLMIGWFSFTLPIGLSLYWNIFSLFSIIQYRKLQTNVERS